MKTHSSDSVFSVAPSTLNYNNLVKKFHHTKRLTLLNLNKIYQLNQAVKVFSEKNYLTRIEFVQSKKGRGENKERKVFVTGGFLEIL